MFLKACENNDVDYVRSGIVDGHLDVNQSFADGQTCLHVAAGCLHSTLVRLLLINGGNPNTVDGCGLTPFARACLTIGASEVDEDTIQLGVATLRALVEGGRPHPHSHPPPLLFGARKVDTLSTDMYSNTVLHILATKGTPAGFMWVVNELSAIIDAKREDELGDLERVCSQSHIKTSVALLILPGWGFLTPLHLACEVGQEELLGKMLRHMRDQQQMFCCPLDAIGWTPLHWAAMRNHKSCIAGLLKYDSQTAVKRDYLSRLPSDVCTLYNPRSEVAAWLARCGATRTEPPGPKRPRSSHHFGLVSLALLLTLIAGTESALRVLYLMSSSSPLLYTLLTLLVPPLVWWGLTRQPLWKALPLTITKVGALEAAHNKLPHRQAEPPPVKDTATEVRPSLPTPVRADILHSWQLLWDHVQHWRNDPLACVFLWWLQCHLIKPLAVHIQLDHVGVHGSARFIDSSSSYEQVTSSSDSSSPSSSSDDGDSDEAEESTSTEEVAPRVAARLTRPTRGVRTDLMPTSSESSSQYALSSNQPTLGSTDSAVTLTNSSLLRDPHEPLTDHNPTVIYAVRSSSSSASDEWRTLEMEHVLQDEITVDDSNDSDESSSVSISDNRPSLTSSSLELTSSAPPAPPAPPAKKRLVPALALSRLAKNLTKRLAGSTSSTEAQTKVKERIHDLLAIERMQPSPPPPKWPSAATSADPSAMDTSNATVTSSSLTSQKENVARFSKTTSSSAASSFHKDLKPESTALTSTSSTSWPHKMVGFFNAHDFNATWTTPQFGLSGGGGVGPPWWAKNPLLTPLCDKWLSEDALERGFDAWRTEFVRVCQHVKEVPHLFCKPSTEGGVLDLKEVLRQRNPHLPVAELDIAADLHRSIKRNTSALGQVVDVIRTEACLRGHLDSKECDVLPPFADIDRAAQVTRDEAPWLRKRAVIESVVLPSALDLAVAVGVVLGVRVNAAAQVGLVRVDYIKSTVLGLIATQTLTLAYWIQRYFTHHG